MRDRGSVSPLEMDNNIERGDGKVGGETWDKMMEPFNQDEEERIKEEEEGEEQLWQEAFGEAAKEGMKAKVIRAGYNPTQREVDEHVVNHLPFRAWCKHCIKGKAKGIPHRVKFEHDKREEEAPVVSVDYMFMHDKQKEGEEKGMPIMVVKDR